MIITLLGQVQLGQNTPHMLPHRALRNPKTVRDTGIARTTDVTPPGRHQRRSHHRITPGEAPQRVDEILASATRLLRSTP